MSLLIAPSRFRLPGTQRELGRDAGGRLEPKRATRHTLTRSGRGAAAPIRTPRRRLQRSPGGAPGVVRPPHAAQAPLAPRRRAWRAPSTRNGTSPARQALLLIAAVIAAIVALPRLAAAQDTTLPNVSFSPSSGYASSSPTLTIAVRGCDDQSDVTDAFLTLNGDGLSYSQSSPAPNCSGPSSVFTTTVTLQPGTNTLVAYVCDAMWNCREVSATYTYTPTDVTPPVVSFSPGSGYTSSTSSLTVAIGGCDQMSAVTDAIVTFNGNGIQYSQGGTVAGCSGQSSVFTTTVALENGSNTLTAVVCDFYGNCAESSATYQFNGPQPTSISVSPSSVGLYPGQTESLTATVLDQFGAPMSGLTVDWGASHAGIVTLSPSIGYGTVLTAQAVGTTTASAQVRNTGVVAWVPVSIVAPVVARVAVSLSPSSTTAGQTVLATAVQYDANDNVVPGAPPVVWRTGDPAIAAVGSTGAATAQVSALAAGQVKIGATSANGVSGEATFTVTAPSQATLTVDVAGVNPGTSVTRDQCVTIAAGDDAAFECGDLRLVHELSSTRTMNVLRTPALVYNSQHAQARALVAANVTASGFTPTQLTATLRMTGRPDVARTFSGMGSCGTQACRIVLAVDGSTLTTGVYAYTLEVVASSGSTSKAVTRSGSVVIVNRTTSPFGAGWWLDGLEELRTVNDSTRLWVGGDGSTRFYRRVSGNTNVFLVTPMMERPDTLYRQSPTEWRRLLRNGAYVRFDGNGRHVETVNRQGHVTSFHHHASSARLDSISLPLPMPRPVVKDSARYRFIYGTANGLPRLASIRAPGRAAGQNTVSLTYASSSSHRVTQISGPDAFGVGFGYDAAGRIASRTNRRNDVTSYTYDDSTGLLIQSSLDLDAPDADVVLTFCPAEGHSLAACASGPQPVTHVRMLFDGPRPLPVSDVTAFHVDRFVAPTRIVDALGHPTQIVRGDSRFPLLATSLVRANGFETRATYTERGLIARQTAVQPYGASTPDAVTEYRWHSMWDMVDTLIAPTGERTIMQYLANGDRQWQQDGRGSASRATFTYNAARQVATILSPAATTTARVQRFDYDSLGNLWKSTTPLGFVTEVWRDVTGRDSVVRAPTDTAQTAALRSEQHYTYDAMDRPTTVRSVGMPTSYTTAQRPLLSVPAETLLVINQYDPEGNPLSTERYADPDPAGAGTNFTLWTYDAAHRKRTESPSGGGQERYQYDEAGNLAAWLTRRGDTIRTRYDAVGRPTERTVPGVTYAGVTDGCNKIAAPGSSFCQSANYRFPLYGDSVVVPTDSQTFVYDNVGNVLRADNHDALIGRTYYPNGQLATDTLHVRAYSDAGAAGDPFASHVFRLRYEYDLSGRRKKLHHPLNVAAGCSGTGCVQQYGYDALSGLLTSVTGPQSGQAFGFTYDGRNRMTRATAPGSTVRRRGFDDDDRLVSRRDSTGFATQAGKTLHTDSLVYDARGKATWVQSGFSGAGSSLAYALTHRHRYSGLGAVVVSERDRPSGTDGYEDFVVDAFGNVAERLSINPSGARTRTFHRYNPGTGQLALAEGYLPPPGPDVQPNALDSTLATFDAAGNVDYQAWRTRAVSSERIVEPLPSLHYASRSYYGADGKLRVFSRSGTPLARETRDLFEEYRYDALGRRVLVRSRGDSTETASLGNFRSALTRSVWDGDRLLYELRIPGRHALSAAALETTLQQSGPHYGHVGYVHGPDLDHPLAVVRNGTTIVPHATWRGGFDSGTLTTGASAPSDIEWAGAEYSTYRAPDAWLRSPGWAGSLIRDQRDESGLLYRRNRYFDPGTGRFTQEDPIGLAGGVNLYGFGSGDPINHSDPFGLCARVNGVAQGLASLQCAIEEVIGAIKAGPSILAGAARKLAGNPIVQGIAFGAVDATPPGRGARWTLGSGKTAVKWANQMKKRGWTTEAITEAIGTGERFVAENLVNKGNTATRYVHPQTGRSVVLDDKTREVIHVGGDGFKYDK